MLKVNNQFLLLEEEGLILNLNDISYIKVAFNGSKHVLNIGFTKLGNDIDVKYNSLTEAENTLYDIFKAMGDIK